MASNTWSISTARDMRRLLLTVALAFMVLQTLGALHRVFHFAHGVHMQATSPDEKNLLTALWGEHGKTSDCQSFDHAIPDGLQMVVLTAHAVSPPAVWWVMVLQERFALAERFFSSRGPPVVLM